MSMINDRPGHTVVTGESVRDRCSLGVRTVTVAKNLPFISRSGVTMTKNPTIS